MPCKYVLGRKKFKKKSRNLYGSKKARPPYKKEPPPYIKKKDYYKKNASSKSDYKYNKQIK